ncbi:family 16 glycoside hydrolase [Chitinophaga sp. RAB17]|uniref:family 16 glycoside hydrolase n=1 Tax=Chitinophaga sp. RAB17 TaxID=3233049 RepID=UPI003F91FA73
MLRRFSITLTFLSFLAFMATAQELRVVNRGIIRDSSAIHLNEAPGAGIAWINNKDFADGTIEFDAKGKNKLQQSFVGIAFHGVNDSTYDAIYFRPFNFQVPEAGRRGHSVQYISLPLHDWAALRQDYPGKYESEIDATTDPNKWFHVKIIVSSPEVSVYVNGQRCLTVSQLSTQKKGMIGYWVGNGSAGDWKNLTIK